MDAHPKEEALPIAIPTTIIPCDNIHISFAIPASFSKMPTGPVIDWSDRFTPRNFQRRRPWDLEGLEKKTLGRGPGLKKRGIRGAL
jgi:hypothetical protein